MPNIFSSTGDGYATSTLQASWSNARRDGGTASDNNNTRDAAAVLSNLEAGKGGGSFYDIRRGFMSFDTSGISVTPSEATLKIKGYAQNSADVIIVKSTAATTVVSGSFDDFTSGAGTALGNTDGSGAGTFAGVSGFTYSAEIATWSTSGYNDIELNSTALDDMASLDTFKICIMEYDYDYLDIAPTSLVLTGWYWADNTGTSADPYIDYTEGVAAVAHSAPFFGANF